MVSRGGRWLIAGPAPTIRLRAALGAGAAGEEGSGGPGGSPEGGCACQGAVEICCKNGYLEPNAGSKMKYS